MNRRYSDSRNVVESLRKVTDELDEGKLEVVAANQCRIVGDTREELEERNLANYVDHFFAIEWDNNPFGGSQLTLHFHEKLVDEQFQLMPVGTGAIDPVQATQPTELSTELAEVLQPVNEAFDIHRWDFAKVSAGSIASGGYLTSFEFEYEAFMN